MKTLGEMTTETREVNEAKGWLAQSNTWGELLALLHSEISEMVKEYRLHRLADATAKYPRCAFLPCEAFADYCGPGLPCDNLGHSAGPPKPEGVGSELADVLIRFLSMYDINKIEPYDMGMRVSDVARLDMRVEEVEPPFGDWVTWLHRKASSLWENPDRRAPYFLRAVATFADRWGIDLAAEYERKTAYNRTREYQHGGTISDVPAPGYPQEHPDVPADHTFWPTEIDGRFVCGWTANSTKFICGRDAEDHPAITPDRRTA
jgi:hypothetical protein